jgi:Ca2+-binding EF-hand superfamily protein
MATEQEKQFLADKVSALVKARFGGDYQRAFEHYDANGDGKVGKDELKALLADAGVGNVFTRSAWAGGIIAELDTDGDGRISWSEFEAVSRGRQQ